MQSSGADLLRGPQTDGEGLGVQTSRHVMDKERRVLESVSEHDHSLFLVPGHRVECVSAKLDSVPDGGCTLRLETVDGVHHVQEIRIGCDAGKRNDAKTRGGSLVEANHTHAVIGLNELTEVRRSLMKNVDPFGGRINAGDPAHTSRLIEDKHNSHRGPRHTVAVNGKDEVVIGLHAVYGYRSGRRQARGSASEVEPNA